MKGLSLVLPEGKYSTDKEDIICYGYDASGENITPQAVVWPATAQDVAEIMKFAYENDYKIIPRGAGTGMTGGSVPVKGAILMSLEKMNAVLDLDTDNLIAVVEPGVINGNLQRQLEVLGYFYPPDPASLNVCTLGGNVAENAGGPRALKYGVTRDYVRRLEAVLPDGRIVYTGVKTTKSVVGYDLTRLLVGSEGTLATITKIWLRILPKAESIITLLVNFSTIENAGKTVSHIIASGIIPRTLEIMDRLTLKAVNQYKRVGLPETVGAVLLIELDGNHRALYHEADKVSQICESFGGIVKIADDQRDRDLLWEVRRAASPALYHLHPNKINEDIVVPINKVSDILTSIEKISRRSAVPIACFGHAGDGNIHVNILTDKKNPENLQKAEKLIKEIFELTLRLEGSISGEHGIGLSKAKFIGMELSTDVLDLMMGIKRLFDERNILNPGKIFPAEIKR